MYVSDCNMFFHQRYTSLKNGLKEWLTSFDGDPVGNLDGSELKLLPLGLEVGCNNMKRRECIM